MITLCNWDRTKEPVTLPPNHVVEHSIVRTDLDDKGGMKNNTIREIQKLIQLCTIKGS